MFNQLNEYNSRRRVWLIFLSRVAKVRVKPCHCKQSHTHSVQNYVDLDSAYMSRQRRYFDD
jgi:hypothetical protein